MSHNVKLSGISIENFPVLEAALNELNREFGTNLTLKVGKVESRNWGGFGNRNGGKRIIPNTVAVIDTGDLSYDITLTKDEGTKKVSMQTEALLINRLIEKFGIDPTQSMNVSTGDRCDLTNARYGGDEALGMQAALGKIIQRYSVITAERTGAMNGHLTKRKVDAVSGTISVVATVR